MVIDQGSPAPVRCSPWGVAGGQDQPGSRAKWDKVWGVGPGKEGFCGFSVTLFLCYRKDKNPSGQYQGKDIERRQRTDSWARFFRDQSISRLESDPLEVKTDSHSNGRPFQDRCTFSRACMVTHLQLHLGVYVLMTSKAVLYWERDSENTRVGEHVDGFLVIVCPWHSHFGLYVTDCVD